MRDWRHAETRRMVWKNIITQTAFKFSNLSDFSCIVILTIFSDVAEYLEEENIGLCANSWWYITNISHLNWSKHNPSGIRTKLHW